MTFNQAGFDIRCEWGGSGVSALAPDSDAIIIVDVMSFTTCVSVAVSRGAIVYPYRFRDESLPAFARSVEAVVAGSRNQGGLSLSPVSMLKVTAGTRLVLPSPNGSTLSLATGGTPTFAGCLRNARAVALAANRLGPRVAVIPAGERWRQDHSLRPAIEDLIGAGAIIRHLEGSLSPEAEVALNTFKGVEACLNRMLETCASGQELIGMGFREDLGWIADLDADPCAPRLQDGAFRGD